MKNKELEGTQQDKYEESEDAIFEAEKDKSDTKTKTKESSINLGPTTSLRGAAIIAIVTGTVLYFVFKVLPMPEIRNAIGIGLILLVIGVASIKIVRPTERGLIESFGKYDRFASPGLNILIPGVEKLTSVNITERLADVDEQEIITEDNLNMRVDGQVYFKIRQDEQSVKSSVYAVDDIDYQIVSLARTTLRNIIGTMTLKDTNCKRDKINNELRTALVKETKAWGVEIVRTELMEIKPPADVQDTMNRVVKAENEKIAAINFATAKETEADGSRRAKIKEAEGLKQAAILEAQGQAEALKTKAQGTAESIRLVNTAATKYFKGNAQLLKRLEVAESALKDNTKILMSGDQDIVNVIGDAAGITPMRKKVN